MIRSMNTQQQSVQKGCKQHRAHSQPSRPRQSAQSMAPQAGDREQLPTTGASNLQLYTEATGIARREDAIKHICMSQGMQMQDVVHKLVAPESVNKSARVANSARVGIGISIGRRGGA